MKSARWPTFLVALTIFVSWLALVFLHRHLPTVGVVMGLAVLGAWYGSLQHEVIHGHVPAVLGWVPLGLVLPFIRYRQTHLDHHRNEHLTDPARDPESFYVSPETWADASRTGRGLIIVMRTLCGRMLLGPVLFFVRFMSSEIRSARRAGLRTVWIVHIVAAAAVVAVVRLAGLPLWIYGLGFVYGGSSLTLLRSFVEHRDVADGTKCAMVETNWMLSLLFLNNNLHAVHHAAPSAPWFTLARLSDDVGAIGLAASGAGYYHGYGEVIRKYALRPFDQPVRLTDRIG